MRTSATNRKLRVILRQIAEGSLIPRPDFQRRLVWLNKHKNAFIETVLEELPFPEVYIAAGEINEDTAESTELLVDGQQRLTTLYQYFTGSSELKLDSNITPYVDLTSEQKYRFLEYEVVIRDVGHLPIEQIKEIFQRINSTSYSLNAMEINNARFDGELKQFCFQMAEHPFFEKYRIFSANEMRRMDDAKYCLSIIITMISSYFNREDLFEEYLEKYDESFSIENKINDEINYILKFIDDCQFDSKSRAFRKADLFTLIIELHRSRFMNGIELEPIQTEAKLRQFYSTVESAKEVENVKENQDMREIYEYYLAALQATNDRRNRIKRGTILRKHLIGETGKAIE